MSSLYKKIYFILLFVLVGMASTIAQVIPKGINYQAVARDVKGNVIQNQKIGLKIYLFGSDGHPRIDHYIESHTVTTNALGLFTLVLGEGVKEQGEYGLIPWNTENIWMEVAIKDKGQSDFTSVSKSKLLAVPYAIHAGTADKLSDKATRQAAATLLSSPGVVSNFWSVFGNANTGASGNLYFPNSLGTTDKVDLILITDNVERLRILNGGDMVSKLNFSVGQNLKVGQSLSVPLTASIGDSLIAKKNVLFNTLAGSTVNYGPFTVESMSPTLLSGTLVVDKATKLNAALQVNGPTDLNDSLSVNNMSPTKLTGTLEVDSTSNLNGAVFVNNASPSVLSGTLRVDSMATFNHKVKIVSGFQTDTSGISPSGSLQDGGGAYIKKQLYVGGIAKFGGPVAFGGAVSITDATQSTTTNTGALRVFGGVGIGLNLNVGGGAILAGMLTIKDSTESMDTLTGALKVYGGVGIKKRLNVLGPAFIYNTLNVAGVTNLDDVLNVDIQASPPTSFIANFKNTGNQHGISIQVNNTDPSLGNHFVEFRKTGGGIIGRIEGETDKGTKIDYINVPSFGVFPTVIPDPEYTHNAAYNLELDKLDASIFAAVIAEVVAVASLGAAILSFAGALASATGCYGLGVMLCAPIISFIIKAGLDVATYTVAVAGATVGILATTSIKSDFIDYKMAHIGVTYESGAGDYAEWLPKSDASEVMLPGYIVGLKNGKISKNVNGASKLMVISTQPAVLGNAPANKEMPYEKVAFLGQVPVHVPGNVHKGDYIVPSGENDGQGRAIAPADMQVEDYSKIVGIAWSAHTADAYKMTNVAIGLNGRDISKLAIDQKKKIQNLTAKLNRRNQILTSLVPGFKEAMGTNEMEILSRPISNTPSAQTKISTSKVITTPPLSQAPVAGSPTMDLTIFKVTKAQISDLLNKAEKISIENGVDVESSIFWKRFKTDPGYKELFIEETVQKVNLEVTRQFEKNKPRE